MRVTISYPKNPKHSATNKLPILIDGKIAGTLTQGKILSLPLQNPTATIGVRGDKKSAIPVKNGDRVQIVENSRYFTLYYFSLAIIPLVLLFDLPALVKIILSILALAITLLGQVIFPKYLISTEKSSDHYI
ncbi:TPA: hypothetical protein U1D18_002274 [Streptococcus suis]|nr:hypothetical protein [Streptococcus suis]HEM3696951.1 hypothetical protein [Streptococcus suis]HEM3716675.1 hypothetical protein [Streptococcus suis]HEM3718514.1 hypothetical protein [Streptococcus suis]